MGLKVPLAMVVLSALGAGIEYILGMGNITGATIGMGIMVAIGVYLHEEYGSNMPSGL